MSTKVEDKVFQAVAEIEAANQERANGPSHHVKCPDCGATLAIYVLSNGRYEARLIKHAT